jgi:putative sigma-54 modulation protein
VQVNISARHGHLSPSTQEKIKEKVEKLNKFHERVTAMHVTVDLEHRDKPVVEVKVTVEHAGEFVGHDTAENALAALDSAIHKVEGQLRKHREKQIDHRATGLKHLDSSQAEAE